MDKTSETLVFHFYSQTKSYLINKTTTLKSAEKTPKLAADRLNQSGVVWSRRKRNIFPSFLYAGLLVPRPLRRRRRHTVSHRNLILMEMRLFLQGVYSIVHESTAKRTIKSRPVARILDWEGVGGGGRENVGGCA